LLRIRGGKLWRRLNESCAAIRLILPSHQSTGSILNALNFLDDVAIAICAPREKVAHSRGRPTAAIKT
jgi:hypothetical protein